MIRWITSICVTVVWFFAVLLFFQVKKVTPWSEDTDVYFVSSVSIIGVASENAIVQENKFYEEKKQIPNIVKSVDNQEQVTDNEKKEPAREVEEKDVAVEAYSKETVAVAENRGKRLTSYKSAVFRKIAQNKIYPVIARRQKQEGCVKLLLTIGKDGKVAEVLILEKSNFPLLDNACLKTINRSSPFPPLPEGESFFKTELFMDYKLD